ncbi:MAG: hypothetical protein JST22_20090 [Bacteroidetes bacterium]|nr:hypothetical protein [Bacteroidota bacterium]
MRRIIQCLALSTLFLCAMGMLHAKTLVETGRNETNGNCYDYIRITLDNNCVKELRHDCDDPNPCGWTDTGWIGKGCSGGDVLPLPSGSQELPSTFDPEGNLICSVASGLGGIYSPSSSGAVCFTANGSSFITITASIMGGLN